MGRVAKAKVQNLKKVREVVATGHAFAALLEGGDVVTWGHIVTWPKLWKNRPI